MNILEAKQFELGSFADLKQSQNMRKGCVLVIVKETGGSWRKSSPKLQEERTKAEKT